MKPISIVALIHGPDRPGFVAQVAGWIYDAGGNILHADQHRDAEENVFFQRVEWTQPGDEETIREVAKSFSVMARQKLGMSCQTSVSNERARVGVLVAKIPHCLHDLAFRFRRG